MKQQPGAGASGVGKTDKAPVSFYSIAQSIKQIQSLFSLFKFCR